MLALSILHEHPAALNGKEDVIEALARHPMSNIAIADQCRYGLVTPSEDDPTPMKPAMKPTKFLTNSEMMAPQLQKRCRRDHKHQPPVGDRCKDDSYYLAPLVRAILKGIALQHGQGLQYAETLGQSNELIVGTTNAIPMSQAKSTAPVP